MKKTKNILIRTKIPAPGTLDILKKLSRFESRSMQGQLPIVWKKAKDFNIYDISNNKFIDFTSTIFVSNIGHSNKRLKKYISKTLKEDLIHSYAYINKVRTLYLKELVEFSGKNFDKAFLMSAGTEATEAALKLMRMNGQINKKKRLGIICFEGNWHGRTMGAQLMSGNKEQKKWVGFEDKNIHHLPFPYPWIVNEDKSEKFLRDSLNSLLKKKKLNLKNDICGVMIETFQGWGALYYPKKYMKLLEKICKKNRIILSFDEMQSGFARTGYKFGYEYYDVKPDLICCGKGMGGGVAVSGVIGKKKIMDLPEAGNMSSTNSANPIACQAGLAVLDEIKKKKLVSKSKKKGKFLFRKLNNIKKKFPEIISYVSGHGLIYALIFKNDKYIVKKLRDLAISCMKDGLLVVYTGRESIKIGPPLSITLDALEEGTKIIEKNLNNIFSKR